MNWSPWRRRWQAHHVRPMAARIPWHSTRLALDALVRLEGPAHFSAEELPEYTAAVPDMLRLAGIAAVAVSGAPSCRWIGQGGSEVALNDAGADAPIHRGHLEIPRPPGSDAPADVGRDSRRDLLRQTDFSALAGQVPGPAQGAANPLPWGCRALAMLPGLDAVGAIDSEGTRHAAQVLPPPGDGIAVSLELAAGAATRVAPLASAVADARWEVSPQVLDNGRVRVEFDAAGRINRLCWDGTFAHPAGPWPTVSRGIARQPTPVGAETVRIAVPRAGPAFASVVVDLRIDGHALTIHYRLHAHDDVLHVTVSWVGSFPIVLGHPTRHHGAPLACGDERSLWLLPQAASALAGPTRAGGVLHATLANGDGRGLALAFPAPTTVWAHDGDLRLGLASDRSIDYAIIAAARPAASLTRLQAALAGDGFHAPWSGAPLASPLCPVLPSGVEALWWRAAADWEGEILLVEQSLSRARGFLYFPPGRKPARAARVDARGGVLAELDPTPEGDGWIIDLDPGAIALVRWRCRT